MRNNQCDAPIVKASRPSKTAQRSYKTKANNSDLCRGCNRRFHERTNTPMAGLRTPVMIVAAAINVWTEGLGLRATGRSFSKSHNTITRWEQRLSEQLKQWSPPAPKGAEITIEGDEVYTRLRENLPPPLSQKVGRFTLLSAKPATG